MSDETDDALEPVNEDIHHHAHASPGGWIPAAAVTTAILAALAAVAASLAGHALTQSSRDQIRSNDQWGYYEAKSIKAAILQAKIEELVAAGKPASEKDQQKIEGYEKEMKEIKKSAEEKESASDADLHTHEVLERGVTFFHISIPLVAIAVLTKRKMFWYGSILCGVIGIVFLTQGLMHGHGDHAASSGGGEVVHVSEHHP